jgi:hypothetical protein
MFLLPIQSPYVEMTLPDTASYLIFANATIANPASLPGITCELVDETTSGILDSQQLPASAGTGQVSLTATAAVSAGTVMAVTCGSTFIATQTITAASIAAIEF